MTLPEFPPQDFCGLPLHGATVDGVVDWLTNPGGPPRCAMYLNAHTANLALRQGSGTIAALRRADLVYADGMAVVRAARRRGLNAPERISGADFFPRFCETAARRGRTLALVGGAQGLAEKCAANLTKLHPGLTIPFTHHGYVDGAAADALIAKLAAQRPDIVLLGMGSPAQENLALRVRDEAGIPVTWCVGALFEYFTPGVRRHAPLWMRRSGLEWLFRLSQEPQRLARRYLLGNPEFLWRTRK